jgi:multiple sugar transport system permease protein
VNTRAPRRRWELTVVGVALALLFLLPFLAMLLGSLKTQAEILRIPPTYLPTSWRFDNYRRMWSTPETPLPYNLVSTLAMSALGTLLVLAVSIPAAYYTARQAFPGRAV